MSEREEPSEIKIVPCKECLKEVPVSEAKIEEASDYVMHFCGLECYEKWRKQDNAQKE